MNWNRSFGLIGGVCIIGVAAVATEARAEIYRWTDAGGGQHFSTDLNSVPAQHRAEAEASAGTVGRGAIVNMISSDNSAGESGSAGPAAPGPSPIFRPVPTPETVEKIAGYDEAGWRARVHGLNEEMSALERQIEACKDLKAPVRYNRRTGKHMKRRHYDDKMDAVNRCSVNQSSLAAKKRQLENLTERARKQGVPPGWLRAR